MAAPDDTPDVLEGGSEPARRRWLVLLLVAVLAAGMGAVLRDAWQRERALADVRAAVVEAENAVATADARIVAAVERMPPVRFEPVSPAYHVREEAALKLRQVAVAAADDVRAARDEVASVAVVPRYADVEAARDAYVGYLGRVLDRLERINADVRTVYENDVEAAAALQRARQILAMAE